MISDHDWVADHAGPIAATLTAVSAALGSWVVAQTERIDSTGELVGLGGLVVLAGIMGRVIWNLAQIVAERGATPETTQLIEELRQERDYWRSQALYAADPPSPDDPV